MHFTLVANCNTEYASKHGKRNLVYEALLKSRNMKETDIKMILNICVLFVVRFTVYGAFCLLNNN